MNAICIEAATAKPVTDLEVIQHLNRGADEGVADLAAKIAAAVASIEMTTGPIMESTWRVRVERVRRHGYLYLPAYYVKDVVAVKSVAEDGTKADIDAADYVKDLDSRPGRIRFVNLPAGAVEVEYEAGWASATVVPPELKHAVLLEVGHMAAHRESVIQARAGHTFRELPRAVQYLTANYAAAMGLAWGQE